MCLINDEVECEEMINSFLDFYWHNKNISKPEIALKHTNCIVRWAHEPPSPERHAAVQRRLPVSMATRWQWSPAPAAQSFLLKAREDILIKKLAQI